MKKILLVLAVLAVPRLGLALDPFPTTNTTDAVKSTHTCAGVSISSVTPTNVVNTSTSTALYTFVAVQNFDATYDLYCSENVSVSTQTASTLQGMGISNGGPGATIKWALAPGMQWYCITANPAATSRAIVCRGR